MSDLRWKLAFGAGVVAITTVFHMGMDLAEWRAHEREVELTEEDEMRMKALIYRETPRMGGHSGPRYSLVRARCLRNQSR